MTVTLSSEALHAALELAVRAPSIHNTQPWRFQLDGSTLHLYADPTRRLPATDPDGRDLMISCGAVLHHLRIALAALGHLAITDRLPDPANPDHLATIETMQRPATRDALSLAVSIPRRRSDRRPYQPNPIAPAALDELTRQAAAHATHLRTVPPGPARTTLVSAIAEADAIQRTNPRYTYELTQHTPPGSTPDAAGTLLILATTTDDPLAQLHAGEATSAVLLAATRLALATCPITQPLEIPAIRATLAPANLVPQMIIRIGQPPPQPNPFPPTRRRHISQLLTAGHTLTGLVAATGHDRPKRTHSG